MSTNEVSTEWVNLLPNPITGKYNYMCNPTGINGNNYIIIECQTLKINAIYKYKIDTDQWSKIDGYEDIQINSFSSAFNVTKQTLFATSPTHIIQIQLNNGNIIKYNHNLKIKTPCKSSKTIILNDSLLIIGGYTNDFIWKYDFENKTVNKFCDMYNKINIGEFGMVYTKNTLLLFGGMMWYDYDFVNHILEFNVCNKQWNKLPITLPKKLRSPACTIGINRKYVFLFGGYGNNGHCDNIYIYSLKYKTIKESKIKCPSKSDFSAITINNNIKDEMIVFG
eukprot:192767_1